MAITFAAVLSPEFSSTTDAVSFTTASWTRTSGKVYVATVSTRNAAGDPATPTASSTGIGSWTQINTSPRTSASMRTTCFRGVATDSGSTTFTADFGAESQGSCTILIDEYTGVDTTTPIVQSKVANGGASTSMTLTLDSSITAGNATAGSVQQNNNDPTVTVVGSGYTRLSEEGIGTPGQGSVSEARADGNTVVAFNTSTNTWALIGFELTAAADGGVSVNAGLASGTGSAYDGDGELRFGTMTDDFNRSVTDGWGTASGQGVYDLSGAASGFDVASSVGTIVSSSGQLQNVAGLYPGQFEGGHGFPDGGFEKLDTNFKIRFKTSVTGVGATDHVEWDIRLRCLNDVDNNPVTSPNPTDDFYRVRWRSNGTSGDWEYRFAKSVGATQTQLDAGWTAYGGATPATDEWWWARAQAQGSGTTTLRLRLWKDGTSEPSTWVTLDDTEATLQAIGGVAIGTTSPDIGILFSFSDLTASEIVQEGLAVLLLGGL